MYSKVDLIQHYVIKTYGGVDMYIRVFLYLTYSILVLMNGSYISFGKENTQSLGSQDEKTWIFRHFAALDFVTSEYPGKNA
jgi:hypothetical protein